MNYPYRAGFKPAPTQWLSLIISSTASNPPLQKNQGPNHFFWPLSALEPFTGRGVGGGVTAIISVNGREGKLGDQADLWGKTVTDECYAISANLLRT